MEMIHRIIMYLYNYYEQGVDMRTRASAPLLPLLAGEEMTREEKVKEMCVLERCCDPNYKQAVDTGRRFPHTHTRI